MNEYETRFCQVDDEQILVGQNWCELRIRRFSVNTFSLEWSMLYEKCGKRVAL